MPASKARRRYTRQLLAAASDGDTGLVQQLLAAGADGKEVLWDAIQK